MNDRWVPDAWQEAAQPSDVKRYALVELAPLSAAVRTSLFEAFVADSHYWPLLDDDTQPHLKREGPWLLEVNNSRLSAWRNLESIHCAVHAWIESEFAGERLASHLAPAMVVENPAGKRALLRFYLPEIIERLHAEAPDECQAGLFGSIDRWWYRDSEEKWAALGGVTSQGNSVPWELKVSDELWAALHGDAEVMKLTAELLESRPDVFQDICTCERPRLVAKALEQADTHGLTRTSDRRTYAYLQLSQGEDTWQSNKMLSMLLQATNGEMPLLELLDNTYGEST